MNTKIELRDMRFYAFHGCYDTEQRVGTRFVVNLSVNYDGLAAASSDNVADAVNYLDIYATVKECMSIKSHTLENVASRILDAVMARFDAVTLASVDVEKLTPPLGGDIQAVRVSLTSCR